MTAMHMRPGMLYGLNADGTAFEVPAQPQTEGFAYGNTHALGQHPQDRGFKLRDDPAFAAFNKIPAWYVATVILPGIDGATGGGVANLRPEPFILERITWATTGDTPKFVDNAGGGSVQGRSVTCLFDDNFTKFLGQTPCLISALFGDSNGFLDLERGLLFQGKQTLSVTLQRLFWPDTDTAPAETRFDICFQGIGLLPMGVNQSGAAG